MLRWRLRRRIHANTIVEPLKDPFPPTNLLFFSSQQKEFILQKMNPCHDIFLKLREDESLKNNSIQIVCIKRRLLRRIPHKYYCGITFSRFQKINKEKLPKYNKNTMYYTTRGIYGVQMYTFVNNNRAIIFKQQLDTLMTNETIEEAKAFYENLDENTKQNLKFQIRRNCKSIDDEGNCMIWLNISLNEFITGSQVYCLQL